MKNTMLASVFLALTTTPCLADNDRTKEVQTVQSDVRNIIFATYGSDVDTVVSYTHPEILKGLGGPEGARETLSGNLDRAKESGLTLESLTFPKPPDFIEGDQNDYVVVHTEAIVAAWGQRARSINFQLGSRPKGSSKASSPRGWKYVEGSKLTKEMLRTLFPDFPSDYSFPKTSRERL